MNPRAMAGWTAGAIVIVLVSNNPVYRALVVLVAINLLLARKRSDRRLRPLLLTVVVGSILALVVSMALSHAGDHVVATIPLGVPGIGGPITLESAIFGLATGIGIAAGVLVVAPLSMVLDPHQLVDALPRPLERAGAAIAAALNMVPGIGRSLVAIREAQSMRGWRPRGPRSYAEILVPVVLTSMESSIQLAEAMEARAFGSGARTRWMPEPWRLGDTLVAVTALLAAIVFVAGRITGLVSDWYPYPSPSLPAVNPVMVVVCVLLLAPLFVRHHD